MNFMRKKAWSPYIAGIIVGLLQIPAFLIINSALGVSSSYVSAAGYLASLFDRTVEQMEYFNNYMTSMKYAWQSSMVIGIAIGAFISRKLSGAKRKNYSPIWHKTLAIHSLPQRLSLAFIGGFIMIFGARWAGGCTSGHGLSGSGQLAISSMIVVLFMAIGGILTANLFKRL